MPESKITSKGQVTIPKQVRDMLRIDTGDRVQFLVREDGVVELRPQTVRLEDVYGVIDYAGEPATVEEMNEGIATAVRTSFAKSTAK